MPRKEPASSSSGIVRSSGSIIDPSIAQARRSEASDKEQRLQPQSSGFKSRLSVGDSSVSHIDTHHASSAKSTETSP